MNEKKNKKNIVLIMVVSLSIILLTVGCSPQNIGDNVTTTDGTVVEVNEEQGVFANNNNSNAASMDIEEVKAKLATLSYDSFDGKQEWRNQVLLGDGQILSFSNSDALCYTNLETGVSLPICTIPDCEHNNSDCSAIISYTIC